MADPRIRVIVEAIDNASDRIRGLSQSVGNNMEEVARKARTAGIAMTAMGGAGLYASNRLANSAMEVERAYANVSTMMDNAEDATEIYKGRVRELTKEIGTQGGEIDNINALYQILSAGITDNAQAMEVLEVAMKSAVAGVTSTEVSVDALTTVLNAYNMEADQAEYVSDVLFTTVKRGKTTYEELARSLGTVVPIASQLGIGIDEVSASVATMTRQGIDAGTSTTYLRGVMNAFLKPSTDMEDAVRNLGYSSAEAMLRQEGLSRSLEMLQEETGGSAERLADLFGNVRGLTAVMALGGEASEGYADDLRAMGDTAGVTMDAFGRHTDTVAYKTQVLDGRFAMISATLGESTSPAMLTLKSHMADLGEWVVKADQKTNGMIGTILTFGSATLATVGPIMSMISQMYLMIAVRKMNTVAMTQETTARSAGITAMLAEKMAIISTTVAKQGSAMATKLVTVAQWLWNTSLYACPLVWIIALIIGLIAIVYLLTQHTDKVTKATDKLWDAMKDTWEGIKQFGSWIKDVFFKILEMYLFFWIEIPKMALKGILKIVEHFEGLPGQIWEQITELIAKALTWGIDFAKEFIKGVTDGIKNLGGSMVDGLRNVIGFDVRANDMMAMKWGEDLAEYKAMGYERGIQREMDVNVLAGTGGVGVGAEGRTINVDIHNPLIIGDSESRARFLSLFEEDIRAIVKKEI